MRFRMNDKVWIILFAYVIDTKCVNAKGSSYDQEYHTKQTTWQAASDECGANGLEFDETVLMNNDALLGTEFWIGLAIYRVTTPWIEILGCYAIPGGQEVKKSPSIVLCQKQCESYKFFGYSVSTETCFCHQNRSRSYDLRYCIGNNDSQFVFVYKVFKGHVSDNNDGKCTTLSCREGADRLSSANCSSGIWKTRGICKDGHVLEYGHSYDESKQLCLSRYQLLLPPDTYCHTNVNEGIHHWTNVLKEETTAKLTEEEAGSNELLSCLAGFISQQNGKTMFNITRRVCGDTLEYFMCRTETAFSTTSEQSLIEIDIPEKVSSTILNIDETSTTTSSQSVPKLTIETMTNDSSASFDTGPVIGGIVGAITLLAVVLVMMSCKIRSCGIFKTANTDKLEVQFSTEIYEHSENLEVRRSEKPISNELYDLAPITSNNTYAVVNKIKKDGLQKTEDTYTETSYGEYDRLNGVSKRRTDSKTNLYDSNTGIRSENDPTYDSSNHGGKKLQFDNDVYDHTDTLSTDGSDYGYSSTLKSEIRNENDVYDKTV